MDKLKKIDLFPKVNDDFYQRTASGGVITIGASLIMAALFFSELGTGSPRKERLRLQHNCLAARLIQSFR